MPPARASVEPHPDSRERHALRRVRPQLLGGEHQRPADEDERSKPAPETPPLACGPVDGDRPAPKRRCTHDRDARVGNPEVFCSSARSGRTHAPTGLRARSAAWLAFARSVTVARTSESVVRARAHQGDGAVRRRRAKKRGGTWHPADDARAKAPARGENVPQHSRLLRPGPPRQHRRHTLDSLAGGGPQHAAHAREPATSHHGPCCATRGQRQAGGNSPGCTHHFVRALRTRARSPGNPELRHHNQHRRRAANAHLDHAATDTLKGRRCVNETASAPAGARESRTSRPPERNRYLPP